MHILRSHVIASEGRHPGSGETCLQVGIKSLLLWRRWERAGISPPKIEEDFEAAVDQIASANVRRRRLCVEDLDVMLSRIPRSTRESVKEMIVDAPLGTTFSVKKGTGRETSITARSGCTVRVNIDDRSVGSRSVEDPRIVLIDGTIDTVGQIHRILTDSSESGRSYIIGCRSVSDDVANTLNVNFLRGTIKVLTFTSRIDDLTVGALDDVAAYTGSSVISAQSGESISTYFDRLRTARGKFWVDGSSLRTTSQPSDSLVAHLDRLRRDAESGGQSVSDFLLPRILGMSSSRVEIIVGVADLSRSRTMLEIMDTDFRSLAASFTRGVSDSLAMPDSVHDQIREIIRGAVPDGPRSAGSAAAGVIAGLRFARNLNSIGHAVVEQNSSRS
jgi:hypothetical protein